MQDGLLLLEKVVFEVSKKLGKQTTYHLAHECVMQALEKRYAFKAALLAHLVLAACVVERDLDHWLDPAHYTNCVV